MRLGTYANQTFVVFDLSVWRKDLIFFKNPSNNPSKPIYFSQADYLLSVANGNQITGTIGKILLLCFKPDPIDSLISSSFQANVLIIF